MVVVVRLTLIPLYRALNVIVDPPVPPRPSPSLPVPPRRFTSHNPPPPPSPPPWQLKCVIDFSKSQEERDSFGMPVLELIKAAFITHGVETLNGRVIKYACLALGNLCRQQGGDCKLLKYARDDLDMVATIEKVQTSNPGLENMLPRPAQDALTKTMRLLRQ